MKALTKITLLFLLLLTSHTSFADGDDEKGLQKGDLSFSLGAGKTILFNPEFDLVAPFILTAGVDYAILNSLEIGLEYSPVFFANKSSVEFNNTTALKNHNFGGIQMGGLNLMYNVYNDYGVAAYINGGFKYGVLDKNTFLDGQLHEMNGQGFGYGLGFGVRYYLGDEYGDVFPWFFDMGLTFSRFQQQITNYKLEGVVQPKTDSHWADLNYNVLDVVIRFGYRFRLKK